MKVLGAVLLAACLSACGFQLAGSGSSSLANPSAIAIKYTGNTNPLKLHIHRTAAQHQLALNGTEYEISIGSPEVTERNLSIETRNRPLERELEVELKVSNTLGDQIFDDTLNASTVYTHDPQSPATSERARSQQLDQLYQRLSQQIIDQFIGLYNQQ